VQPQDTNKHSLRVAARLSKGVRLDRPELLLSEGVDLAATFTSWTATSLYFEFQHLEIGAMGDQAFAL
jgi:hypothetical protein